MKTCSIIDPPVRNGGIAASRSYRPYSTPTPLGPEHLVPGERGEIHAERGEIDRHVRHRLAGVEHGQRADPLRGGDQHVDRVDGAQHIGLVGERDHLGPRVDQLDRCRTGRAGSRR